MADSTPAQGDALPNLDDLLQCPVCYEIPSGQIHQCNEGHHVCGRCKARLDLCPVCRSLFYGTRNFAMEELISSVKKLQAFKLGGKMTVTSGSPGSESTISADNSVDADDDDSVTPREPTSHAPPACKGVFRCLCCGVGDPQRLPAARMLNHLRYHHRDNLIEGSTGAEGEFVQTWQSPTKIGRQSYAIRVADMGIFFFVIEMSFKCIRAWVSMAASPWIADGFCYTIVLSGDDREALFTDCVWSVRSCEGSRNKRGRCLLVTGSDAFAILSTPILNSKLFLRRAQTDLNFQNQPRVVVRVANRITSRSTDESRSTVRNELQPLIRNLQDDVERISHLVPRDEDGMYHLSSPRRPVTTEPIYVDQATETIAHSHSDAEAQVAPPQLPNCNLQPHYSRNARRRMNRRLRAILNATHERTDERVLTNHNSSSEDLISTIADQRHHQSITSQPALPSNTAPSNNLPHNRVGCMRRNRRQRR